MQQLNLQVKQPATYTAAKHSLTVGQAKNVITPVASDSYLVGNKLTHFSKLLSGGFDVLSSSQTNDLAQHKTANSIYDDVENDQQVSLARLAQQQQEDLYTLGHNNMLSTQALEHTSFGHGDYRTLPKGVRELDGQKANLYRIDWSKDSYYTDSTHTKLKNFKDLTVADQQDLKVKLSAAIFASTLTHEMGHSLGLRHNFMGSMDAQNYNFTDQDMTALKSKLAAVGYPNIEPHSNSSSHMEYSINAYSIGFGPYDMAALRFGYARQVELTNDALSHLANGQYALPKNLPITSDHYASLVERDDKHRSGIASIEGHSESLDQYSRGVLSGLLSLMKSYQYCTDENTFLTHTCNRFDAGFTGSQITHNMIESYKASYLDSNTRNNRDNFGINYLTYYTITRINIFSALQAFIDDSHDLMADGESGLKLSNQNIINTVIGECHTQDPDTGKYDEANIPTLMSLYNDIEISSLVCDLVDSTQNGRQFLLDTALSPIERRISANYLVDGIPYSLNLPLDSVKSLYVKANGSLGLEPGEVLLDSDSNPQLLRDMTQYAVDQVTDNKGKLIEKDTVIKGISMSAKVELTGQSLNSMISDTADPNHPYVNDRDVLGVWPDKLLAVRTLLTRSQSHITTSSTTASLVDSAFTGEILKLGICRQALGNVYPEPQAVDKDDNPAVDDKGNPIPNPDGGNLSACLSVLSSDIYSNGFQDQTSLNAVNSAYAAQNVSYNSLFDWATTNIETVPSFAYPVASYFNLPITGNVSLLRAMLNQFVLGSSTDNTGVQLNATSKGYREFASVYDADSIYNYQTPIMVDFNNLTDESTITDNLDNLTSHSTSAKSLVVRMVGSKEDFVIKENNRLALVLLQAYFTASDAVQNDSNQLQQLSATNVPLLTDEQLAQAAALSDTQLQALGADIVSQVSLTKDLQVNQATAERLAKILQTMPRTDRNAELDDTSLLATY
ncbi:hypothetical protein A9264_06760 [Vibrio sp. UCD-FRSSP16_10]|uniref:zinc-dependent metalloprotease n=1 Tax=unclassified Vibrio TaxID=2614977 RepID=UPI0007FDBE13|nr:MULTISPECIES: zinc-dependent metalloprotease [unclassified Vibrio]OBT15979.1 hypothetical protein A9264_06760 [Vibrio sp. UCD-FRSSP16_10]OBT17873.1 hypothetical protein A9260_00755 [Vibrio sp. UCD-FRSSP16_30]